ncbi:MAG: B12-binding domain-containing radical SAM protein [Planctomycetota bacterium]
MRVLFIYPNIDCPPGANHGLVALSGVLKANGHDTKMIYACDAIEPVPSSEEIAAMVREYDPGLLAFSVMTQQYPWAVEQAKYLRKAFPEIPQAVGGVHITMVPDEAFEDQVFDYYCAGEGDYALLELVNRLEKGEDTTTTPNMRVWKDGKKHFNPVLPFPNLDTLPPLDYDLFDMGKVLHAKKGWLSILTSRGCPYKCTYCFNKEIVDLYRAEGGAKSPKEFLRKFPIPRIMEEIQMLRDKNPGISTVIFDDDLFTLDKPYVLEFCKAYKEAHPDLPFVVNCHVQVFDDEMACALKEAGCMIVKYGLESGSPRVRKEVLWRWMKNEKIAASFESAHRYDLHTSAFVMIGLPSESREEIEETIDLCAEVKMGRFRWAVFFPFVGTAAHRMSTEQDLIDYEKMDKMGNYFDGSCLKFGDEHDLYLVKLSKFFHWYVNARTDWPTAETYRKLVAEIEAMDRATFEAEYPRLKKMDREMSDEFIDKDLTHYTQRYSHVMGVRSDFVKWERERIKKFAGAKYTSYTLD